MILGVSGKIASGKSEVMKIFQKKGFYCIYADKIVHDLYKKGRIGAKKIETYFGEEYLNEDGSVDRNHLREVVFLNSKKRKLLESLIHPLVFAVIIRILTKTRRKNIAIESVYFDQKFLGDFVDKLIWIRRPKRDTIRYLVNERGFSKKLAEKAYGIVEGPG